MNGLAQTLLKLTVPGVPDFYQGNEFWDLSLVDPDNRRPVDFARRVDALNAAGKPEALAVHWRDGRMKQAVIRSRAGPAWQAPELFARGAYRPLDVVGPLAANVVAFAALARRGALPCRRAAHAGQTAWRRATAVIIPPDVWRDTVVHLPDDLLGRKMRDAFSGECSGA